MKSIVSLDYWTFKPKKDTVPEVLLAHAHNTLAKQIDLRRNRVEPSSNEIYNGKENGRQEMEDICPNPKGMGTTWNPKQPVFNGCLVKQPFFYVKIWFIIQLKQPIQNGWL